MITKTLFGGYELEFYNASSGKQDKIFVENADIIPTYIRTYYSLTHQSLYSLVEQYLNNLQREYVPNEQQIAQWKEILHSLSKLNSRTIKTLDIAYYQGEILRIIDLFPFSYKRQHKAKIDLLLFALNDLQNSIKMVKKIKSVTS